MPIEKYYITRDRDNMLSPVYWNGESQASKDTKNIYNVNLSANWFTFKDGRSQAIYLMEDWEHIGDYVSSKMFFEKNYIKKIRKQLKIERREAVKTIKMLRKIDLSNLKFNNYLNYLKIIKDKWIKFNNANVLSWYVGGDKFGRLLADSVKLSAHDFLFLSTSIKKTAAGRIDEELINYAKLILENKKTINQLANKASEKFGWIPFRYDGLEYWDEKYFKNKLLGLVKSNLKNINEQIRKNIAKKNQFIEKRNNLIRKNKIPRKKIQLFEILGELSLWTDDRKEVEFQLHYFYSKILLEFEKKFNIPYHNLKFLFFEELKQLPHNKASLYALSQERIKSPLIVKYEGKKREVLVGKETRTFFNDLKKQLLFDDKIEIKGDISSKGSKKKYTGTVKVVLSIMDCKKIKRGDFIVSTMTSPDYMVAMKNSGGIITDEGGVTCHAAIISRELNKPCITGTVRGTKILKDGDVVEINVEDGSIKKLKNKLIK